MADLAERPPLVAAVCSGCGAAASGATVDEVNAKAPHTLIPNPRCPVGAPRALPVAGGRGTAAYVNRDRYALGVCQTRVHHRGRDLHERVDACRDWVET